jgi:spore coat protein U-like protein
VSRAAARFRAGCHAGFMARFKARVNARCGPRRLARLCALPLVLLPLLAHGIGTCTVTSSGVALGGYTFSNVLPTDASGNIEVSCSLIGVISLVVNYEIRLSTGASGSYPARQMGSGANRLRYNLYTNAAHAAIWGDGTAGTSTVSDFYLLGLLTTVRDYPVYGRAPAGQNTPAGVYTDMITVTVAY